MDVRLINPFICAVQHVFRTMVRTEVRVGKPYIKTDGASSADVSSVIGFSGDATGCVVLSFPRAVACRAASAFAGTAIDQNHPDFADAIGELANIVAGNAKKDLNGLHVEISLPNVVIGSEHVISQSRAVPRLVLPCETAHGRFFVEVGMRVDQSASAPAGAGT